MTVAVCVAYQCDVAMAQSVCGVMCGSQTLFVCVTYCVASIGGCYFNIYQCDYFVAAAAISWRQRVCNDRGSARRVWRRIS